MLAVCSGELSQAAPLRISFLPDVALSETAEMLQKHGCQKEAVTILEREVRRYHGTTFNFDFAKFPPAEKGFYTFSNIQHLVTALPHPLWKTEHTYEFNCFDAVILLSNGHLRTALKPDERVGKYVVLTRSSNDMVFIEVATAEQAFTNKYAPWYRDATERVFPKTLQDERVCLTAALFRRHTLPESVKEEVLAASVLEALRKDWRIQKLAFPENFRLVAIHQVHLPSRAFTTTHAGLLFQRGKGYVYLEKAGGSGPFVRLDFEDRTDLLVWLAAALKGLEHEHTHVFATFNDASIEDLRIPKTIDHP